jgi:hypothetical protein
VEQNRKADQNPPRVVAPIEKEENINLKLVFYDCKILSLTLRKIQSLWASEQNIKENI